MLYINEIIAILSGATFAISSVIIRKLDHYGSSSQLNLIRTGIGGVLFILHLLIFNDYRKLLLPGIVVVYLVLSVLFNVVIGDSLYFSCQNRVGVKISAPLVNTYPLFTIILAIFILDEEYNLTIMIGSLIIIIGIIFLSLDSKDISNSDTQSKSVTGLLFGFGAVLFYSLGMILITIASINLEPVVANSIRLPSGTLILLFWVITDTMRKNKKETVNNKTNRIKMSSVRTMPKNHIFLFFLAGFLGTYISSLFLVYSVQTLGAGKTSVIVSTAPLFALPFAVFWLKEKLTTYTLFGTVMTIFGLFLILNNN
ncbi:MAG: DMT family transporter [Candidatus Heimdallarchaeota archaeon]|nr:DMT family transporter [Candidatus Heimdallarchaeota archaeon]